MRLRHPSVWVRDCWKSCMGYCMFWMRKGENDERIAVGISSTRLGWGRLVDSRKSSATGAAPGLSTATWKALPIRGCEPGAKWRLLSCVHMCCLYVLCGEADHPVPLRKGGGKGDVMWCWIIVYCTQKLDGTNLAPRAFSGLVKALGTRLMMDVQRNEVSIWWERGGGGGGIIHNSIWSSHTNWSINFVDSQPLCTALLKDVYWKVLEAWIECFAGYSSECLNCILGDQGQIVGRIPWVSEDEWREINTPNIMQPSALVLPFGSTEKPEKENEHVLSFMAGLAGAFWRKNSPSFTDDIEIESNARGILIGRWSF